MQKTILLKLLPSEAVNEQLIKQYIAKAEAVNSSAVSGYHILKSSIDARSKQAWVNLQLQAYINEPYEQRQLQTFKFNEPPKK
jgi:hypothetical protein